MSVQDPGQGVPPSEGSPGWQVPPTTPGPAPGVEFGGFGERLIAYIVDIVIVSFVVGVIAAVGAITLGLGAASDGGFAIWTGFLILVVAVVVSVGYFPWFWARDGQTPGMRMLGLQVVRDVDGGPISGMQALLRLVGYWVSGAVFYLGYVWILIDDRRRGWHDLIAGTVVIKRA